MGCSESLVTYSWGIFRGGAWQDWPSTMLALQVSWEMLMRATQPTRQKIALFTQVIFGEVSEKTWERISEETLRYYRATRGSDRDGISTWKCVFCKISLDTSVIALAQWVESTGTGSDRSINSFYSRQLLIVLLCLKNEKENKRK